MATTEQAGARRGRPGNETVLALALLCVELIAAVQSYLTGTITPLMAQDLAAQQHYGLLAAGTQAAMFLTMPLGAALLARYPAASLLSWLTPVIVVGGVVSALAPEFWVFLAGRVLAALASGALMTVSLSALVTAMSPARRRLVLAGYAMVWLVASLAGPGYAAWLASTLDWRWALVAYLPLLVLVRWLVITRLRMLDRGQRQERTSLGIGPAVVLAGGVTVLSLSGSAGAGGFLVGLLGAVLVLTASARILPPGVLRARPGTPAVVLVMMVLTASYFGSQAIVAITAHDLLGRAAGDLGLLLAAGGLGWSALGMVCGRWPARGQQSYRRRVAGGSLTLGLGTVLMALAVLGSGAKPAPGLPDIPDAAGWPLLLLGWGVAGVGMGLCYVDTLNRALDAATEIRSPDPTTDPGPEPTPEPEISAGSTAQAMVMSEVVGTALAATGTATVAGWVISTAGAPVSAVAVAFLAMGGLALALVPLSRRT